MLTETKPIGDMMTRVKFKSLKRFITICDDCRIEKGWLREGERGFTKEQQVKGIALIKQLISKEIEKAEREDEMDKAGIPYEQPDGTYGTRGKRK